MNNREKSRERYRRSKIDWLRRNVKKRRKNRGWLMKRIKE